MRLQNRVTLSVVALAAALMLAACGKKPQPADQANANPNRAQAQAQAPAPQAGKGDSGAMSPARIKLKSRVQSEPKSGEARYLLGALLLAEGDAPAAVTELQRAQEFHHPDVLVLPKLAEALADSGQGKRVIEQFANLQLPDAEATASLLAAVAQAQAQQGDPELARKTVDRALAAAPQSTRALITKTRLQAASKDTKAALATIEILLAAHPDSADGWAIKGDLLLRTPDGRAQALVAYDKAVQLKPDHLYALSGMVSLRMMQGDIEGAKKDLARLQKVAPKHIITGMFEAHLAYAAGEHAKAREIYQAMLKALPEEINILMSAGENELKLRAPQQAESYFAKASSLAPRNAIARRLLAEAQIQLGQPARALITLAPLVDASDASAEVVAAAAQANLLNGDARAADALYTRLAKLKPADPKLRTIVASASLGKTSDQTVFHELRDISSADTGTSADLALISAYRSRGQLDEALKAVDALLKKRPTEAMGQHMRGQILSAKNDRAGARSAFEAALKLNHSYYPAVAALALIDFQDKKPDDARKRFTDLLKLEPKNAAAMVGLAELSARMNTPRPEVLKLLEAAVKTVPTDVDARVSLVTFHMGGSNNDAALAAAQSAVTAVPDSIDLLDLLGRCQLRVNQASQALTTYGKIISLQPKSPRGHTGMVDAYLSTNEIEQAQKSVDRALELAPRQPDVIGHAVAVAVRKKQFPVAVELARRLQTDRPADSLGYLLEGEIEMAHEKWDAAAAALRKGLDRPLPGAGSAKLYHALVRSGKQAEADAFAGKWLTSHPSDSSLLFYLGDAAQTKGDLAGAEKRYEQVLSISPTHVLALNNLAMIRIQQKKPGAVELAERAVDGAPEQAMLLDTLAQAYAADNKPAKAVEAQLHAVAVAPKDGMLRLGLARLQLAAGNKALAKAELDRLSAQGDAFAGHEEVKRLQASLTSSLPGR